MEFDKNSGQFRPEGGSSSRIAFHAVIAIAGWILFAYFWRMVGERGLSPGATLSLMAMALFLTMVIILTTLWVVHNVRIARGDRRTGNRPAPNIPYVKDKIGQVIEVEDCESLSGASIIEVDVREGKKIYRHVRGGAETADHAPA